MWAILLFIPLINAISYDQYKQVILLDGEECNGPDCSPIIYKSVTYYEEPQDYLLFKQPYKLKLFQRNPFWSSGNSGNNDGSNEPLDKMIEDTKNKKSVLLVDFYATWCGPCNVMSKNLTKIAEYYRDKHILTIRKVNVDQESQYNRKFEVTALPTLLFIAKGQIFCKVRGVISPNQAIQIIDNIIATL
ncbi:Thioredoxin [Babesia microti strain RI]|uniref:Thioredoxin n=2 Tax=Babesia microti TaxID=5868 RepID=A0A1R4AAZ5_BABMR|nr:Thioredoxin [Babesia microti strain RI]ASU92298.1 Trx3 [Babesia microti]SJK86168.1 Thioredoxin [Babesia microti strain RI]|eukprot:XP_021338361.1 Thioredoxin [Babesia microti strain RI]